MKNIFLVFGYGVPKDITKDENYNFYLKMVFNKIYDFSVKNKIDNPIIIFSGGRTDCFKPYKRNEADEMIIFFRLLCNRFSLKKVTKNWLLLSEKKSISTLENFLFCKDIILNKKIKKGNIYIFCEQTREDRIKKLSRIIFKNGHRCYILSIDFDVSSNRYLDPEFIKEKERKDLKHDIQAIKSLESLKKHHDLFEEKLDYFRKAGSKNHEKAIKEFWEMKLKEFE